MRLRRLLLLVASLTLPAATAPARTWTSLEGGFKIEGEAVAFSDTTVIIKRERSDRLAAVEIAELSEADQRYVANKRRQLEDDQSGDDQSWHTWTSRSGWKIRGRVLGFGKATLSVGVRNGVPAINGNSFNALDGLHQRIVLATLSQLESQDFADARDFTRWVRSLGGETRQYEVEGVRMQLESGDVVPVPFVLFSKEDLEVLRPGYEAWLEAKESEAERERENFLMRQEAMQYQAARQREAQYQQMEILKLNMLGAVAGITSIWKVGLRPRPGVYGRPMTVMVSAENSQIATEMALRRYPGYTVFGVARANR
jgi:hypothetical protein